MPSLPRIINNLALYAELSPTLALRFIMFKIVNYCLMYSLDLYNFLNECFFLIRVILILDVVI